MSLCRVGKERLSPRRIDTRSWAIRQTKTS